MIPGIFQRICWLIGRGTCNTRLRGGDLYRIMAIMSMHSTEQRRHSTQMDEKIFPKQLAIMPPIPFILLAFFLSLAWVIPNHTWPWTGFYSDAVTASVLLVASAWVLIRSSGKLQLAYPGLFFLLLAAIPWLQYLTGVIYSAGTAWINSLYLLGFSLAIFAGGQWERATPGQCLDFLFSAIFVAATVSMAIQLLQWLRLISDVFVLDSGSGRYFGNLGQPNQLASLLLLAVIGVARAYAKRVVNPVLAGLFVAFMLFGVALTESRTAWLNIAGILALLFLFWRDGRPNKLGWLMLGFGGYFVALYFCLPVINEWLLGEATPGRSVGDPVRLAIWGNLVQAAFQRPWFGYGWGQTVEAVFASPDFPMLGSVTMHAHNLILDLVLYNGLLLGGAIVVVSASFLLRLTGHLKQGDFIFPALALGVLLIHSMLELPLHHAYFLLPFGMILGVLLQRSETKGAWVCSRLVGYGIVCAATGALFLTVADYLEVERTYFPVRYGKEWRAISPEFMPQTTVLTQWRERMQLANMTPEDTLLPGNSLRVERGVIVTPEPFLMFLLSQHLALEGRGSEAKIWLGKVCKMLPPSLAANFAKQWGSLAEESANYRTVEWRQCPEG